MLQKEMPFEASGDSYQAHHSTEHICPALCLPCSLQSKDLVQLLANNQEGRDGLPETAESSCPQQHLLPSPRFPSQQEKALFSGLQALGVVSGLALPLQYPQLVGQK